MQPPTLFVKTGCPYCAAAMHWLDAHEIAYETVDVRGDEQKMAKLDQISGQTRTPTLVWDGKVLANFGVDQLEEFVSNQQRAA